MFQRPPPFGVLPLNQRESFSYSAFLKNKNLLHPHHPRLKKWSTQLYVSEILPPFGRLDDKMVMIVLIE